MAVETSGKGDMNGDPRVSSDVLSRPSSDPVVVPDLLHHTRKEGRYRPTGGDGGLWRPGDRFGGLLKHYGLYSISLTSPPKSIFTVIDY